MTESTDVAATNTASKPDAGSAPAGRRPAPRRGWLLPPGPRRALTVLHVLCSVGLAGTVAAGLAMILAGPADPGSYRMTSLVVNDLGLPLLLVGLLIGLVSAIFTPWGLLKHGWVVVKLGLLLVVLGVALFAVRPALGDLVTGDGDGTARAVVAGGQIVQLALLLLSTVLSVFKPRGILPGIR